MSACCEIGTYECCIYAFTDDDKDVYVDKCLLEEIKSLIDFGVVTLGCCCGHGKTPGYIQVDHESISKMKELGYERLWNPFGSIAFLPKTQCPKSIAGSEGAVAAFSDGIESLFSKGAE